MTNRLVSRVLAFLLFLVGPAAMAQQGEGFGLGVILGSPTAISGKYWMGRNAIQGGLAYDFDESFTIFADYLWHFPGAFGGRERFISELSPYVGIGGLIHNSDDPWVHDHDHHHHHHDGHDHDHETNVALRIPLGIEWLPSNVPIGVFLELVPAIFLAPETDAEIMGGIGIRYYF